MLVLSHFKLIFKKQCDFSTGSLEAEINKINKTFPELLKTDWREFVRSEFQLLPEQGESLAHVPEHRVREIQHHFSQVASHIEQGGKIQAQVTKISIEEQTPERVHDLHIEKVSSAGIVEPYFRIAHCDANCRHWGWG